MEITKLLDKVGVAPWNVDWREGRLMRRPFYKTELTITGEIDDCGGCSGSGFMGGLPFSIPRLKPGGSFPFPSVKDVIFSGPATIVFWTDGTKTVCKCQGNDTFNPETGIAMCYMKKSLGNTSMAKTFERFARRGSKC